MVKSAEEFGRWVWNKKESGGKVIGGDAVVVDIDGVLSNAEHRQHFLKTEPKDWKGFFSACVDDPPLQNMVELLNWLDSKLQIVLLTARPDWVHKETVKWLKKHSVRWDLLVIRHSAQKDLPARDFKVEAIKNLCTRGFNFVAGFEDDPKNVEALKDSDLVGGAKIPCIYVHSGYYEKYKNQEMPSDPSIY